MSEDILVNVTPQETRVAVVEQGSVQELHIERTRSRGLVSNIYMGRVARVLPGMQSAFIDIGLERAAFLHVGDIFGHRHGTTPAEPARPIEKILQEGQPLLVQVIKDPIGTKGARLSTQISLAGRLLVYLPQDPHIGISQRIENEAERDHLREMVERARPADEHGGFIIRTVAETATERELAGDVAYLRALWASIQETVGSAAAPSLAGSSTLSHRATNCAVSRRSAAFDAVAAASASAAAAIAQLQAVCEGGLRVAAQLYTSPYTEVAAHLRAAGAK
jgi:ribonuclease G